MFLNEVVAIPTHQGKILVVKSQNKYPTFASMVTNAPSIY
jgi:hypothetical protein